MKNDNNDNIRNIARNTTKEANLFRQGRDAINAEYVAKLDELGNKKGLTADQMKNERKKIEEEHIVKLDEYRARWGKEDKPLGR
jgi:hypothetical protein